MNQNKKKRIIEQNEIKKIIPKKNKDSQKDEKVEIKKAYHIQNAIQDEIEHESNDGLKQFFNNILNRFGFLENKIFFYILSVLFLYIFIVNAWVTDDAFITFRTIDNFVHGFGLTWNVGYRVQAYTHPLWMFLVSIFYYITHEPYFTSIVISLILCLASLYLMVYKLSKNIISSTVGITILMFSKSFIDYTSSGLENPLSYFLFALFLFYYFKYNNSNRILILSIISSLIALNRLDTLLICVPILIYELITKFSFKSIINVIVGFSSLILWELFSTLYYGQLFPTTAYSKLNNIISSGDLFEQGIFYFSDTLLADPLTILIITAVIVIVISNSRSNKEFKNKYLPIIIGLILYLIYILKIGGDFMLGRFFALPLFICVLILSNIEIQNKYKYNVVMFICAIIFGIVLKTSPVFSNSKYGAEQKIDSENKIENLWWFQPWTNKHGISDERAFYYPGCGLLPVLMSGEGRPISLLAKNGIETRKSPYKKFVTGGVGMFGYYAGKDVYIIDLFALSDPMLARLPNSKNQNPRWRIGHFERDIPDGYFETINSNNIDYNFTDNIRTFEITDKKISKLVKIFDLITKGNIFDSERINYIIKLNTGGLNYLIPNDYIKVRDKSIYPNFGDSASISKYLNNKAAFALRDGDHYSATYFYSKAIGYNPGNIKAISNLVKIFIEHQGYDISIQYLKKYDDKPEIKKNLIEVYMNGAYSLQSKKKYDDAIILMEQLIQFEKNNAHIYANLGSYYFYLNNDAKALENWNKALSIDPNSIDVYFNMFQFYYKKQDWVEAAKIAQEMKKRKNDEIPANIIAFLEAKTGIKINNK